MMADEEGEEVGVGETQQQQQQGSGQPKTSEGGGGVAASVGGYTVHVAAKQLPLVGMFFSGIVLLIALCVKERGSTFFAYGVSVASVAMFFSLVGLLLTKFAGDEERFFNYNAYFLFLWCIIGACILTFGGPFKETGNGYFASWGLAIFSIMGVGVTVNKMKSAASGLGSLLGLGVSSIIVIAAIAPDINGTYRNESIYAIVVAALSLVIVAVFCYMERGEGSPISLVKFPTLAFFAVLWIVLACLVTFRGPFLVTGNGYFGSWGGAVTSVFAAMAARAQGQQEQSSDEQ